MAAAGTGVGRDNLLVVWVLARVLTLVRDVVVAVLRIDERSEAEADARDVRDDRYAERLGGIVCGGGGGARRVVVAIDEEETDRTDNFGELGTEHGGGGVGTISGGTDEGDLDEGL